MATHYVVVVVIVEFNFETKFCAGVIIMLMLLYFGKLEFQKRRALGVLPFLTISQWFPIIIYVFKDILDTFLHTCVLKPFSIVFVDSVSLVVVSICQISKFVKKLVSALN